MRVCPGVVALVALLAPWPASALDWSSGAAERTVAVLTADEDGAPRETTAWLVVVDGAGYLRTGNTTWGGNVVSDPNVRVRIRDREDSFVVTFVEDAALRERVVAAFREKYGWTDALLSPLRGRHPKIMRLDAPRAAGD